MFKKFAALVFFASLCFGDNFLSFSDPTFHYDEIKVDDTEKKLLEMKKDEPNAMFIVDYKTGEIKEVKKEK